MENYMKCLNFTSNQFPDWCPIISWGSAIHHFVLLKKEGNEKLDKKEWGHGKRAALALFPIIGNLVLFIYDIHKATSSNEKLKTRRFRFYKKEKKTNEQPNKVETNDKTKEVKTKKIDKKNPLALAENPKEAFKSLDKINKQKNNELIKEEKKTTKDEEKIEPKKELKTEQKEAEAKEIKGNKEDKTIPSNEQKIEPKDELKAENKGIHNSTQKSELQEKKELKTEQKETQAKEIEGNKEDKTIPSNEQKIEPKDELKAENKEIINDSTQKIVEISQTSNSELQKKEELKIAPLNEEEQANKNISLNSDLEQPKKQDESLTEKIAPLAELTKQKELNEQKQQEELNSTTNGKKEEEPKPIDEVIQASPEKSLLDLSAKDEQTIDTLNSDKEEKSASKTEGTEEVKETIPKTSLLDEIQKVDVTAAQKLKELEPAKTLQRNDSSEDLLSQMLGAGIFDLKTKRSFLNDSQ